MTAALIAAFVSLAVTLLGWWGNEIRYHRQHRAEAAIKKLLVARGWKQRTFTAIKRNVGGFDEHEDELRRLLVRSGAVRFYKPGNDEEMWGLLSKNEDQLQK